jgi:hypothetical protein
MGEQRRRFLDSTTPRKIFGPKKVEVNGRWRKLRTDELHDLHSSSHIIRVIKIKHF